MNQDQIERDRLLTEVHENMKHLVEWTQAHDASDNKRFESINKKLLYGALAIIIVAFASGVLGQLLSHINIG